MSCDITSLLFTYVLPALLLCYLLLKWRFSYWKNRGVLSTEPRNPLGDLIEMNPKQHIVYKIQEYYETSKQLDWYFGIYEYTSPVLLLTNLRLIKFVLESDKLSRTDNVSDHMCGSIIIKHVSQNLSNCSEQVIGYVEEVIKQGQSIDVLKLTDSIVFNIIGSTVLGLSGGDLERIVQNGGGNLNPIYKIFKLKSSSSANVAQLCKMIRNSPVTSRLLQSFEDKGCSLDEICETLILPVIQAMKESSKTISFALFELSRNRREQEKLRSEIKSFTNKNGRVINCKTILEMPYLEQTVNETLRLYPPTPNVTHVTQRKLKVPNTDIVIEKYTKLLIPIYSIHRNWSFYRRPNDFNPNNFMPEVVESRDSNAFLPFTERKDKTTEDVFQLVTKYVITTLVDSFNFKLNEEKTGERIEFDELSLTLDVKNGIWLNLVKIDHD